MVLLRLARACWTNANAFALKAELPTWICMKLMLALGNVDLNKSSASSSFNTLMVSAKAVSSSARIPLINSQSPVFVAQLYSNSSLNFSSSDKASLVSSKSFSSAAIFTDSSPIRVISVSICFCRVATSLFFAAIKAS